MPKVSVVIASYNHEKYISQAIQSVLNQTFQDFEIIIFDDHSTDGTVNEIKKFKDPRIKLFCSTVNEGQFPTVRKCIDRSQGEYIAILNSDDAFYEDKLEKQVNFLDLNPSYGAVFSHAQLIDDDGKDFLDENNLYYNVYIQSNRSRYEWLNFFFFKGNCFIHPSVLIRKSCHDQIGHYKEHFTQISDYDFWVRLCFKWDIHIIPEKLTKFRIRRNEANLSGNKPESIMRYAFEHYQLLKNYLSIKTIDNFVKIFPDFTKDFEEPLDDDLIPFYISMYALKIESPIYRMFALDTISTLFENEIYIKKMKEKCNFKARDFIRLTGTYDPLNYVSFHFKSLQSRKYYHNFGDSFTKLFNILIPKSSRRRAVLKKIMLYKN